MPKPHDHRQNTDSRHQHHESVGDDGHHGHHDHHSHHAHMVADFRRRFWVSLVVTIPIIVLAPMIQGWVGLEETLDFTGDSFVQFAFATVVFFYGGWPFLKGLVGELKRGLPGMMTLIALAISVAHFYSSAVVFGLEGEVLFWELATLINIMLLGHWIEMRSVMGASAALETPSETRVTTRRLWTGRRIHPRRPRHRNTRRGGEI